MKTKLAQLSIYVNNIDRRQIQLAYFIFMLAAFLLAPCPADGGTGPI